MTATLMLPDPVSAAVRLADETALLSAACRLAELGVWRFDIASGLLHWPTTMGHLAASAGCGLPLSSALLAVVEADRGRVRAALKSCARRGIAFDLRIGFRSAERLYQPVRLIGEAVRDPYGRIGLVHGAIHVSADPIHVQADLVHTAARLTAMFESITDALFTLDREWCFEYVNHEAAHILRRHRDDLVGRSLWDTFPSFMSEARARQVRSALLDGETVAMEVFSEQLDRWFDLKVYPSVEGFAVYFRDTTIRRRTEEQLRLLHTCLERLHDVVLITDAGGGDAERARVVYVNGAFERQHGVTREAVIGVPIGELRGDTVDPHDFARVHEALNRGESFHAEITRPSKSNQEVWAEIQVVPVSDELGATTHFFSVERDITLRKRDDAQLRLQAKLLDEARDMILVRDLDHRIELWNRAAERLLGWSASEVLGRDMVDGLYCDPDQLKQAVTSTLATGGWEGTIERRHRDGHVLTFESRWTLVRDDHDRPRAFLSIDTDVSDRRRLEQQFLRAQRLESLGTLAGGIAHDLNNMLSPIMLSVDLLKARAIDDDSRDILELIGQAAQQGADMVGQVLTFARGADGRRVAVDADVLITDVVAIARKTFPKDVKITTDVAPDCWALLGDATQLHQVLLNLCVNARDAMPEGGRLSIAAKNVMLDSHYAAMNVEAQVGPHLCIELTDTGSGIPPALLDVIFEPFFTTKAQGEGTGLGLATCTGIVSGHGGFMRVRSEVGTGTHMTLYLPASIGGAAPVREEHLSTELRHGAGELVLIVDDEVAIREVTKHTLEAFGYRAMVAADGPEAIAIFAERGREIDLVLTDMMMPVMDGIATARVLLRMNPDLLIIAASGVATNGKAAEALEVGVREFLPKPYTSSALLHVLQRVLSR